MSNDQLFNQFMNRLVEEEGNLKAGLSANPDNAELWVRLGAIQLQLLKNMEAEMSFRKAVSIKKKTTEAWLALGYMYINQGKFKDAEDAFESALKKDSKNLIAMESLGNLYYGIDGFKKAEKYYQKCINKFPKSPHAYLNLGNVYFCQGQRFYNDAEKYYKDGLEQDLNYFLSWLFLGRLFSRVGRIAEAGEALQKAYALAPEDQFVNYFVGFYYETQGDYNNAENYYRNAVTFNSLDKADWKQLGDKRFYSDVSQGRYAHGIEQIKPAMGTIWAHLGYTFFNLNKIPEAESSYLKALELHPNDVRLLDFLGVLYLKQDLFDRAESYLNQAKTMNPNDPQVIKHLQELYSKRGTPQDKVKAGFDKAKKFFSDIL